MQALGENPTVVEANYAPWGQAIAEAVGDLLIARTDAGTEVQVWRPNDGINENYRFWCHGHATLSFHLHGYSIFSGLEMAAVLRDEWTHVTKKPLAGDIIVFRGDDGTILHSARIETAIHSLGKSTEKELSSKNGAGPLMLRQSVDQVLAVYNDTRWRVPEPCCCGVFSKTVKQYYRRNNRQVGADRSFR